MLQFRRRRVVDFVTVDTEFRHVARPELDITLDYFFTFEISKWIQCRHSKIECPIPPASPAPPPQDRASAAVAGVGKSPSRDDIREAVGRAVGARLDGREIEELVEHVWGEVHVWAAGKRALPSKGLLDLSFRVFVEDRSDCLLPAPLRLLAEEEVDRVRAEERCCSICLGEFGGGGGGGALRMPCLHVFHGGCIVRWLEKRRCCPLCRREMPAEEI